MNEELPITYSVIVLTTRRCLFSGSWQECWDWAGKQNFRDCANTTIRRN